MYVKRVVSLSQVHAILTSIVWSCMRRNNYMLLSQMEPSGEIGLTNGCSIPLANPKSAMAWAVETFRLWKGKIHPRIQDTTYESVSLSTNTLVSAR